MSCYNWEQGSLKIPAKDWPLLKKAVREAHNKYQQRLYEQSLSLYEKVCAAGKGKRKFSYARAEDDLRWSNRFSYDVYLNYNDAGKPLKPKKKDYALAKNTTTSFMFQDAHIGFINESRIVEWHVSENNKAVQDAHSHPIGAAFFRALEQISWTSKTGGVFIGNDEYNRDSDYVGGGGNYITKAYGGIGKRERGY